jgi:hypothetical protein
MPENLARWFVSIVCAAAALVLIGHSMSMNYVSWRGQGGDDATGQILGNISIGFDAFKCILPVVIAWCWSKRKYGGVFIAVIFFCGCLAFSLCGALGFADSTRNQMVDQREAANLQYATAQRELSEIEKQIASLGIVRPQAVVKEMIEQSKQDRRWASSNTCKSPLNASMRNYCQEIAKLSTELAAAIAGEQLRKRVKEIQTDMNTLFKAGVRSRVDAQAEIIAKLLGLSVATVQTSLSLLVTLLLEFGAAIGLFIAALPLTTRKEPQQEIMPPPRRVWTLEDKPRRLVRADGKLIIE